MATYTITVVKTPSPSSGAVKVGSELVNGNVQEEGVTVNIIATPLSGFAFVDAYLGEVLLSTTNIFTFVMPSNDVTLTVNFSVIPAPEVAEQTSVFDTGCPKFFVVPNLTDRFFSGDLIDLSTYTYTEVEEPQKFSDGKFKLERDPEYHGFNYEFSVDNLEYELGTVGYDYLKNKLITTGTDSDVKFLYGFGQADSFTVFYLGKIDFNEYKEIENGEVVSFGVRELDFDNILQTAFEVEQSTAPDLDLLLYSKVIPKKVTYTAPKPDQVSDVLVDIYPKMFYAEPYTSMQNTGSPTQRDYNIFINDGREGDDLDIFVTYDFSMDRNSPYTEGAGAKYLLRAKQAGTYKLELTATFKLELTAASEFEFIDPTYNFLKLIYSKTESDGVTPIGSTTTLNRTELLNSPTTDSFALLEFTLFTSIDMQLEECLYLFFKIDPLDLPVFFGAGAKIDNVYLMPYKGDADKPQITIVAETLEKASITKTIAPLPLLESIISKSAETDYTTVVSDFFGDGGCGNKLSILNGFNVRSAELSERTYIKTSAKKLIDNFKDLFCIGWGVEYNEFKQELIRIEPVEYFYSDVEIMSFDSVSDYQKEIDSNKYYNEIEVGFSNYSKNREKDKGNTIDDFHTKHLYQTPIKTNKNKISMVTDLTLSGYEIEILRRKQFEKKGEDENANFKEDEDLFGVQLVDYTLFNGASYEGILSDLVEGNILRIDTTSIIVMGYAYFYNGQSITVNVDGQGAKQTSVLNIQYRYFTVAGFVDQIFGTLINFTAEIDPIINVPFSVTVSISTVGGQSYIVPESDQGFSTASNMISPQTCYNLRYSPKRVLYNHAKTFNGGFFGKAGTELISFKQGDGNVELETQFKVEETCLLGDVDRELIIEDSNVMLSDIYNRGFLHLPIKVSFSAPLSFEQLTDLKDCLRGRDDYRNYGYVTILNSCGVSEQIYLTSVEYSGVEDEVKMEGYLKSL